MSTEIRSLTNAEYRAYADGDKKIIEGYAAVWGCVSDVLYMPGKGAFVEVYEKGCFLEYLRSSNVEAYMSIAHDKLTAIARTPDTLTLEEDDHGLRFTATPIESMDTVRAISGINAKLYRGCSLGFRALEDSWKPDGEILLRTIHKASIFDVAICLDPAYVDTSLALRSLEAFEKSKEVDHWYEHTMFKIHVIEHT